MPLIDLWKTNPDTINLLSIEQIVNNAGNGKLTDGSLCSLELRTYLSEVQTKRIQEYTEYCLSQKFEKGGQVLQDLVNELGRRLDYSVENGLYAGKQNAIGNDGLWLSPEAHHLVVEVKTTDAYRISLDTIAKYRNDLIKAGKVGPTSSILLVVGRQDTGELEAQVRGSRHAWDVRLVSVEALVKLALIKENSEEIETGARIRSLLIPVEYTRLDGLIEAVFTAAQDTEKAALVEVAEDGSKVDDDASHVDLDDSAGKIVAVRQQGIAALSQQLKVPLIKKSRATYWSPDHSCRVACTVSKQYEAGYHYWYAFHPKWLAFLSEGDMAFCVLGCTNHDRVFSIPLTVLEPILPSLNITTKSDGSHYWHLRVEVDVERRFLMRVPHSQPLILEPFAMPIAPV